MAGLICMADPRMTSRITASKYYYHYKGMPEPIRLFGKYACSIITGSTFDIPSIPFGPYAITGFYYAVKHLGLTDQMVMGADEAQTNRIMHKIHSDPIMNLIVESPLECILYRSIRKNSLIVTGVFTSDSEYNHILIILGL
jgi:hypothetical protein